RFAEAKGLIAWRNFTYSARMNADASPIGVDKPCLSPLAKEQQAQLLQELLSRVSRSFYLTLRVLPKAIRPQIGLAYLLARTTDTIADTNIVSMDQRLDLLHQMRKQILSHSKAPVDFGDLAKHQGSPAE